MTKGQRFYESYAKAVGLWVDDLSFVPRRWQDLTLREQAVCEYAAEFYEESKDG